MGITSLIRGAWAFITVVRDPRRLESALALVDRAAQPEILESLAYRFGEDPLGARALQEFPRVGTIDLPLLERFPEGSLGRSFALHMRLNGLDPGDLPVREASDPHSFIQAHLIETHDIWHVVTGWGTDVTGEIGLQAFYAAQSEGPLPLILISAIFLNTVFFARGEYRRRFQAVVDGWQMGRRSKPLFGIRWNALWAAPLDQIRLEHGIA